LSAVASAALAFPAPRHNKWLVTVSVTFGTLMGALDASIVNVAIPHIRGAVGATVEEITWVNTGYVVAQVMVMPLTAFLGRLYGQKRVYMFCLGLFVVGSVLCGLSHTLTTLVLFRVIQGLGAGALQPTEQAILRQTFPLHELGMAMAAFGMAVMLGPALGPTLGGYIVDNYPWEWIFYINVPIGLLGLFMVGSFVDEPADILAANRAAAAEQRRNMDWAGIALLCMSLASLQYVLEEGQRDDWFQSPVITAMAVVAAVSITAFVMREVTARSPAVRVSLFRDPVFTSGTLIGSLMFAMLFANMFLLPIFMQELLGFTAVRSGIALMPRTLVMMAITPIIGRIYNRLDARLLIVVGVMCISFGSWQMSHFTLATTSLDIYLAVMTQGVGFGCLFPPLTTIALSTIPRDRIADATGLNSLLRQLGGSVGLAVFATYLSRQATVARADLMTHVTALRPEVAARAAATHAGLLQRGLDATSATRATLGSMMRAVAVQGLVLSFEQVFLLSGILFLGVLPLVWFMKAPKLTAPEKPAHVEME